MGAVIVAIPTNAKDFLADMAEQAKTREPITLPEEGVANPVIEEWLDASDFAITLKCLTPSGDEYLEYALSKSQFDGLRDQLEKDARRRREEAATRVEV